MQSLLEVAEQIRTRQVSPVEVVEAALERAEALNPALNCYITILSDRALAQAAEAEREIGGGNYRGPLHGVPISVKDIFQTAGIRTTSGSRLRANWVPDEDATAVRKLEEAGAVLLAKANTFQFACSPPHPDYGPTRNPWNLTRTTRGSSSGSASAVGAGLDFGSIGSDTGGSIRVPASFCGLAGMKPSFGLISRFGMQQVSWTMDHAGPLARTVPDLAILLQAVSGFDARDPQSAPSAPIDLPGPTERLDGVTIAIIDEFFGEPVLPEILAAVETATGVLREAGASIRRISIPELTKDAMRAHDRVMWPEIAHVHRATFPEQAAEYSEFLQEHLAKARTVPASDYLDGLAERDRIRRRIAEIQRDVDLFLLPTAPVVATELESMEPDADPRLEELAGLGGWNAPFDLTGQPSLTVPCGFSEDNLPIGMQIIGRELADSLVLRAGQAYQSRTEWHLRHPDVATLVAQAAPSI